MNLSHSAFVTAIHPPTGLQVESWRLLWEELVGDAASVEERLAWAARRERIRPQMLDLLGRYLAGAVGTEELRATFDHRTRTDWDAFGLKGMSGAMYLNRLVRHVADGDALAAEMRAVLPAPPDVDAARERLGRFAGFLQGLAARGGEARQLQPARAAFFVSMWWHLQEPELWPAFHQSARQALHAEEGLYVPSGDAVQDYFAFREAFRALAEALRLTAWELEYLCWWHLHRDGGEAPDGYYHDDPAEAPPTRRPRPVRYAVPDRAAKLVVVREPGVARRPATSPADAPAVRGDEGALGHTPVQWLLAKIGRKLGCRVWIAANDRHREWTGESLANLSVRKLPPLGIDPDSQRVISLIDVVWLTGANQVAAAFEVERTSSIYSGLLRMADLTALSPNLNFPLYIVAPRDRLEKVRRELSRPTFQLLELHRRCGFFSDEALLEAADSIMRWASGPSAIEKLASRVEDVRGDGGRSTDA